MASIRWDRCAALFPGTGCTCISAQAGIADYAALLLTAIIGLDSSCALDSSCCFRPLTSLLWQSLSVRWSTASCTQHNSAALAYEGLQEGAPRTSSTSHRCSSSSSSHKLHMAITSSCCCKPHTQQHVWLVPPAKAAVGRSMAFSSSSLGKEPHCQSAQGTSKARVTHRCLNTTSRLLL